MSDVVLEARGVRKSFWAGNRELPVLHGIDLKVREGETLLIYGPSGAGKSTLLHILALIDRPTEGEVLFEGRCVSDLTVSRRARIRNRNFGLVFQFFHLLPDFTALENVMLPLLVGGVASKRAARKRALQLLEVMGLTKRLHHRPSELSGGEQQRVAIARALITRPKILFLDEPTGSIDTETASQILSLLQKAKDEFCKTFVMVTHNRALVWFGTRVINIVDGRIVKEIEDASVADKRWTR